jgi:16S rRNA (uracil1498-N3)-methyltransferase
MPRLYLPSIPGDEPEVSVTGESARYLLSVLRVRKGSEVTLFDSLGRHFSAEVIGKSTGRVRLGSLRSLAPRREPRTGVLLLQGLLKGSRMDLVVQKATELGVSEIVPVVTERSQVRGTRKLQRWRKIALEASRQSGRPKLPTVHEPVGFSDFLESLGRPIHGFIFREEGGAPLGGGLMPWPGGDVYAAVGPEGGFTGEEVRMAEGRGFGAVTLGPLVLRAETASISALTLIQYLLGEMG